MSKITQSIAMFVIVGVSFLIPAFFLTTTTDYYDFNKFALLYLGVLVLAVLSLINLYRNKEIVINSSSVTIPAILFAASTIATVILNSPNKVESLLTPQGAGGIIVITLWFLMLVSILNANHTRWIIRALVVSTTILGLLSFLQIMGVGVNLFVGAQSIFSSKFWTPAGSLLTLIMLLVALAPIVIIQFERALRGYLRKDSAMNKLVFWGGSLAVMMIAVIVILSQLFFTARPVILPFAAGWTITLESLKNVQRAILGVGPGNYIFAYTTGKPAFMNITPYWNIRFLSAPNWYMQVITELGLLGLGAYALLILGLVKKIFSYINGLRKKEFRYDPMFLGLTLSILVILLEQLILPGNFVQLFVLYTLLAILSSYLVTSTYVEKSKILAVLTTVFGGIFFLFTSYVMSRAYSAEYYMKRSVDFSAQNKAKETYDYQTRALITNPYIDRYHIIFSQTNLALATALSQKKNLSDKEKMDVITLLTQTTNEGKNAIFANPTNVQNWENLARIYKTMVNQVKDADKWALQAYNQSIALDPLNPLLRLETGGVYYSVGQFDGAIQIFNQTANLKPDWPNAYYNLALAFREKKDYTNAAAAMQKSIDLLPKDSKDKDKAQKELDEIKKNVPAQPAANGQQGGDLAPAATPNPTSQGTPIALPSAAPNDALNRAQTEAERLRTQSSPAPTQGR